MKTRVCFLLIFLCVLLWVPSVLSKKYTDTKSNDTFSFDGSTTSTTYSTPGPSIGIPTAVPSVTPASS